jgi:hypothetical protein
MNKHLRTWWSANYISVYHVRWLKNACKEKILKVGRCWYVKVWGIEHYTTISLSNFTFFNLKYLLNKFSYFLTLFSNWWFKIAWFLCCSCCVTAPGDRITHIHTRAARRCKLRIIPMTTMIISTFDCFTELQERTIHLPDLRFL